MKIPDDKIQEVRESTDIIEVVSQYVTLKKRGKSFMGLCPFHTEKTPSFSVDPVRGFYHCFGCGAGGNVFTFMMQMEKVSFPEAVRSLAEKAGIVLPEREKESGVSKETEILYRANRFAADFFQECLNNTKAGRKALDYLSERGFNHETLKLFEIGYAPQRWDGLLQKAQLSSIPVQELLKAGLVISRKGGQGYYDRFRGRIIFPVRNPSGRIVGFGGRALNVDEKVPKYINSPETQVYQKSYILYGLFLSKQGIRREDRVILVEGYTDVVKLHQHGLDYVVSTSGTALTIDQGRVVNRYTRNAILFFDGDSAGFAAALRGVDLLVEADLDVQVAPLPGGADPDSYLQEKGREAVEKLLHSGSSFIDFQIESMRKAGKLRTAADKATGIHKILGTVVKLRDPLERNILLKDIAEKMGVQEAILNEQIRTLQLGVVTVKDQQTNQLSSMRQAAEVGLLKLLIEGGIKWENVIFRLIDPAHFNTREAKKIVEQVYKEFLKGNSLDFNSLLDRFSDDQAVVRYLSRLFAEEIEKEVDRSQLGLDCVLRLREEQIQDQIREVQLKIKSGQQSGQDVSEYSKIFMDLKNEIPRVRKKTRSVWKKEVEK
jgi:DNA primase